MKKIHVLTASLILFGMAGCVKVDNDTYAPNNSQTTNNYNGVTPPGTGGTTNPPNNPTGSPLNVKVDMYGQQVSPNMTYNIGQTAQNTVLNFTWDVLPTGCNSVIVTAYMYDRQTGANYIAPNGKVEQTVNNGSNTASINLPTMFIPNGCDARISWNVTPQTCSGKTAANGELFLSKR